MADEEEQLEDLKKWWQENGRIIVIGVVLGLGGVGGYSYWRASTQAQAEHVSALYSAMISDAGNERHESVLSQADAIVAEFPDSGYAGHAALFGAASAYSIDDRGAAQRLLLWAAEHAPEPFLRQLARLRLARLLLDGDEFDAGLAELDKVTDPELEREVVETRADALRYQGQMRNASELYARVLEREELDAQTRARVKTKLDWVKSQAAASEGS